MNRIEELRRRIIRLETQLENLEANDGDAAEQIALARDITEARRLFAAALSATPKPQENTMTSKTNEAFAAINIAARKLEAARRDLDTALSMLTEATAKECVENKVPYQRFLKACATNANSSRAQWSGGADSPSNVVEAATRSAWISAATDVHIAMLFHDAFPK